MSDATPLSINNPPTWSYYNSVATFDEQDHTPPTAALVSLAKLFIKHDAHAHFGIALLHRHEHLARNMVMVQSISTFEGTLFTRCQAEPWGRQALLPCMFLFHEQHGFLPLEYTTPTLGKQAPTMEGPFLHELANFLVHNKLQRVFGLARRSAPGLFWAEYALPLGSGTIAISTISAKSESHVVTEWAFEEKDDEAIVCETKTCEKDSSAAHSRPSHAFLSRLGVQLAPSK